MYRKMVWCYVFILTLLDISLNTKLTAQGKSHGVTVQDPLRFIERIPFQDGGGGGGAAAPASALRLEPPALAFGRRELARPHALTVTLTNTHNGTMHLASVAGTTPDFHASFFDSKTLPPDANTSFSVVFLGRREGPAAAHLYIHTSLGVIKYPVSAEGVANEWDVWPLVGMRVPHNASVHPLLTMHNPTDHIIQVSEVYSSGAWLGLQLPEGAGAAPRDLWALPPHTTRPLVRLRPLPPPGHAAPLTAYVRIKTTAQPGALVVPVEARPAPPGEHLQPLQLRLRPRGAGDPPVTSSILAGNSAATTLAAHAALWAARCGRAPHAAPPPDDTDTDAPRAAANGQTDKATANGVKSDGVHVSLLRSQFEPHQPLKPTAQLTFDFAKMWETYMNEMEAEGAAAGEGAWCSGWVRVGRAALPYSVRLLPGTLRLVPDAIHVVTANMEEAFRERVVRVHNEFSSPVQLLGMQVGPGVQDYFRVVEMGGGAIGPGETVAVGLVRLTRVPPSGQLDSWLLLRTAGAEYRLPLRLHGGRLRLRWRWPGGEDALRLGALPVSSTRRVRLTLYNPTPETLCVRELRVELAGALLALDAADESETEAGEGEGGAHCVPPGGAAGGVLSVVAPARAGALLGVVAVRTQHAATEHNVSLHALQGRLHAHGLRLNDAAPFCTAPTPLVVESSMAVTMRALGLHHDRPEADLLAFIPRGEATIASGRQTVGSVVFSSEKLCQPHCYTGLEPASPEGKSWVERSAAESAGSAAALAADAALFSARRALFAAAPRALEETVYLHTDRVLRLAVPLAVRAAWPRLLPARPARPARPALAGLGGAAPLSVAVINPSHTHALLLQPLFADPSVPPHHIFSNAESPEAAQSACGEGCSWDSSVFSLSGWRVQSGAARVWHDAAAPPPPPPGSPRALPLLLLEPRAEILLDITFTPAEPTATVAYLYLRNNLTIVEAAAVAARGVLPSFELAGRRPGAAAPILFEVSSCGAEGGVVRRTVEVRNTGAVPLRLRDWRLAGRACAARGFRLQPCAPLALRPNETRALSLAFSPDYTLARARASLAVLASDGGRAEFALAAAAPARLLPACAAALPPPPFDGALRAAGALLALAALALVLGAAALDAERELRRARAERPPPAPAPAQRRPLDLRECHAPRAAPAPRAGAPPAAAPRRRRPPRRAAPPDPQAERRAFERWRAEVLRRAPADDHSSEDADAEPETDCTPPPEPLADDEPPAPPADADADADAGSSGSECSTPPDDRSEPEEPDERDAGEPPDAAPGERDAPDDKERECRWAAEEGGPGAGAVRSGASGGAGLTARRGASRGRPGSARSAARRDKPARRRAAAPLVDVGCGAGAPPAPAPPPRPARRAATWSEVVEGCAPAAGGGGGGGGAAGGGEGEAGARLAPIGSDVRRRGAQSLFYFNESPPPAEPAFAWRAQQPAFAQQTHQLYREECQQSVGGGQVWGSPAPGAAAAAWLWGGYGEPAPALRPPPGFGAPPRPAGPAPAPAPPRPYDPFRSLAAIWGPAALDWRPERDRDRDDDTPPL